MDCFVIKAGDLIEYSGEDEEVTIPDGVKRIGRWAFAKCTSLKRIKIPDSVTSIDDWAFLDCTNLTSITISESVKYISIGAFYHCDSLTSIMIPESVTSIGEQAFKDCGHLTSVSIPSSVTRIASSMFENCSSLADITIPSSVVRIGADAFKGTPWLKRQGDTVVVNNIFARYYGTDVQCVVPDGIECIGDEAFKDCSDLEHIVIPNSVTFIGDAFTNCISLTSVVISTSVTQLHWYYFSDCPKLKSIVWPLPWKEIENGWKEAKMWKTTLIRGFCEHNELYETPELRTEYMKMIIPQKKKLVPTFIEEENLRALHVCIDAGALKNEDYLDEMISFAAEQGKAASTAMLLDYKNHTTTPEREQKRQQKKLEKTFNGPTASELKQLWPCKMQPDGTLMITGYRGTDSNVVVPSSIGKTKVSAIGDYVFSINKERRLQKRHDYLQNVLHCIVLPEGITSIGDFAFSDCSSLTSISIPDSVTRVCF